MFSRYMIRIVRTHPAAITPWRRATMARHLQWVKRRVGAIPIMMFLAKIFWNKGPPWPWLEENRKVETVAAEEDV